MKIYSKFITTLLAAESKIWSGDEGSFDAKGLALRHLLGTEGITEFWFEYLVAGQLHLPGEAGSFEAASERGDAFSDEGGRHCRGQ